MASNNAVGILRVVLGLDSAQFESGTKRAQMLPVCSSRRCSAPTSS